MIQYEQLMTAFIKDITLSLSKERRVVIRDLLRNEGSNLSSYLMHMQQIETLVCDDDSSLSFSLSERGLILQAARFLKKLVLDVQDTSIATFHARQCSMGYSQLRIDERDAAKHYANLLLGSESPVLFRPKHGPGSTAEGSFGLDKSSVLRSPDLTEVWAQLNIDPLCRVPEGDGARFTRVTSVAKDWRGRRVIGMEPTWAMFAQLSLKQAMEFRSSRFIPYYNQYAQRQRLVSTFESRLATVDLSNASDHVTVDLAHEILPQWWFNILNSCRTPRYVLPDGTVGRTESMALMGNGFCFPLLSVVVTSLAFACAGRVLGLSPSFASARYMQDKLGIQAYGDDLVFPVDYCGHLRFTLASAGLQLNESKSGFGSFRETCGVYQFGDENPFRCYYLKHLDWETCDAVLGNAALQNTLFNHGYFNAAHSLERSAPHWIPRSQFHTDRTFGKVLYVQHDVATCRRSIKRGGFTTPMLKIKRAARSVDLADTTGWVTSFHGGVPANEPYGPTTLTIGDSLL